MPKMICIVTRTDKGRLDKATIYGSPITVKHVEGVAEPQPAPSELKLADDGYRELRVSIKQADLDEPTKQYWKPNELVLQYEAVRALRDVCTKFLDRFHDEEIERD